MFTVRSKTGRIQSPSKAAKWMGGGGRGCGVKIVETETYFSPMRPIFWQDLYIYIYIYIYNGGGGEGWGGCERED